MTHSYIVEGITCAGCVAKVKYKLEQHPDVSEAVVTLERKRANVTMKRYVTLAELQAAIGNDTKYTIKDDDVSDVLQSTTSKSWLTTYKPLLIIAAFITGVSVVASHGNMATSMNYFMAGFFLVFSFFKLLDIKGFADSYAMYDVLAKRIYAWGIIYPFTELALGIAYLTGFSPFITNLTTIALMGFSSIGVIQSVVSKKTIQCACLGAVFNLPMTTVTIIEDLLMVAMAGVALFGI